MIYYKTVCQNKGQIDGQMKIQIDGQIKKIDRQIYRQGVSDTINGPLLDIDRQIMIYDKTVCQNEKQKDGQMKKKQINRYIDKV